MPYQLSEINEKIRRDPAAFLAECDAHYQERIHAAVDKILARMKESPIVLLSGASGSGKTTTAMKVERELERRGVNAHTVSMDNYFKTLNRRTAPRTPEGDIDYESPKLLDMELLAELNEGDSIRDFVGPLGLPTELPEGAKRVCVVGGGVGCAIAYPQAKTCHAEGLEVDVIAGFRSKDIVILEDEFKSACDHLYIMTDDGSYGEQGFVTVKLKELIDSGIHYDAVIAIGPIPMMKFVSKTTEPYGIKTIVSLNPIMIDGTGMCGGCRVTVGGKMKFACVDGPDFDGHEVDLDELMNRNSVYRAQEAEEKERHACRMDQLAHELMDH